MRLTKALVIREFRKLILKLKLESDFYNTKASFGSLVIQLWNQEVY